MALGPPSPSLGPRLRLVELLLGPLLVLLLAGLGTALGQKVYTNTWAVHISGGPEEADRIASKHGFINYGHVSRLLHFHIVLPWFHFLSLMLSLTVQCIGRMIMHTEMVHNSSGLFRAFVVFGIFEECPSAEVLHSDYLLTAAVRGKNLN